MNDLDYFYKAITSPVVDVIGLVYVALDFIRKGLKK